MTRDMQHLPMVSRYKKYVKLLVVDDRTQQANLMSALAILYGGLC